MSPSLRALLTGIIDWAGLFPPAILPLEQAYLGYMRYRQEPESWMLGKFVCPSVGLAALQPLLERPFETGGPFGLTVTGQLATTPESFASAVAMDAGLSVDFEEQASLGVTVETYEARLPKDFGQQDTDYRILCMQPLVSLACSDLVNLGIFCEAEWTTVDRPVASWIITFLAHLLGMKRALRRFPDKPCGFKLRCGGAKPEHHPPTQQVAFTIAECRDKQVPLKFTAGLHHPIRHYNDQARAHMHGFINVFVAGVLAHARGLNEVQLMRIIDEEDSNNFKFGDDSLRWQDQSASLKEIEIARRTGVVSFGSCSFDEPRNDLKKLGWLD